VKFEYKYKGSDAKGAAGGAMTVAYDIGQAKTM
jgi:type VI secretion system secreted protein Hcp